MSISVVQSVASAVQQAIADSDRSKRSLSDQTGIAYATLNRKLAGKTEFQFSELLAIAEALAVSPSLFTPPPFRSGRAA